MQGFSCCIVDPAWHSKHSQGCQLCFCCTKGAKLYCTDCDCACMHKTSACQQKTCACQLKVCACQHKTELQCTAKRSPVKLPCRGPQLSPATTPQLSRATTTQLSPAQLHQASMQTSSGPVTALDWAPLPRLALNELTARGAVALSTGQPASCSRISFNRKYAALTQRIVIPSISDV